VGGGAKEVSERGGEARSRRRRAGAVADASDHGWRLPHFAPITPSPLPQPLRRTLTVPSSEAEARRLPPKSKARSTMRSLCAAASAAAAGAEPACGEKGTGNGDGLASDQNTSFQGIFPILRRGRHQTQMTALRIAKGGIGEEAPRRRRLGLSMPAIVEASGGLRRTQQRPRSRRHSQYYCRRSIFSDGPSFGRGKGLDALIAMAGTTLSISRHNFTQTAPFFEMPNCSDMINVPF
jgi:hypothetical protein